VIWWVILSSGLYLVGRMLGEKRYLEILEEEYGEDPIGMSDKFPLEVFIDIFLER
jgi:hypothetical protein